MKAMIRQNSRKGELHSPEEEKSHTPQPGYKNSPLGIIPDDWEVKRLGEICSFKNGINSGKESYGHGVKFVNTMDVLGSSLITNKSLRGSVIVSEKQKEEFVVIKGDILFNRTSETREEVGCASVYIDDKIAVFGGFIIRARCLYNSIDLLFKQYCFNIAHVRNQISSYGNGAIRYNLGQDDLSKVSFLLPPLPVQRKIASILTLWDSAIEKQSRLIEKLELRKKGLMQQLLTGKKRLKGFEGEWKEVKLGEIAKVFSGGTPNTSQKEYYVGDIPFIKSGEIFSNRTEQFVSKFGIDNSSAKLVNVGDILYALYGATSGQCAISQIRGAINQAVLCIRTDENSYFISSILKMNKDLYYNSFLQGGQGNLSADIVKKYIFRLPTLTEQTAIATILTAADQEIETEKNKLKQLRQQKKGLMQVLLTGKKRVKI